MCSVCVVFVIVYAYVYVDVFVYVYLDVYMYVFVLMYKYVDVSSKCVCTWTVSDAETL